MSVPTACLPNQGLRYHIARHWLYTKKKTPGGVLLKSCQKQQRVTLDAVGDCYFVKFVS